MVTTLKSFEEYLAFGQEGEHLVAQALIKKGVSVVPLYQFVNHNQAPFLICDDGKKITMPDLACFKSGKAFFTEVKRKNQWWYGDHVETGTDTRLWDQYLHISNATKIPVYLFFLHEQKEPVGLFYQSISTLSSFGPRIWNGKTKLTFVRHEWLKKFPLKTEVVI